MELLDMLQSVDHTQLKAFATWEDIKKLCEEAMEYHTASVCIPPCYVSRVKEQYQDKIKICTVVGFPLGYSVREVKEEETRKALRDGADEIDMVINIADVKNGDYEKVQTEIASLKRIVGDRVLKVIIETCYLTQEEKNELCNIVTNAHGDYIKTSTGFGTGGATLEDVALFRKHIGPDVNIKAAGGVTNLKDLRAFLEAGCARIGTSRAVDLIKSRNTDND